MTGTLKSEEQLGVLNICGPGFKTGTLKSEEQLGVLNICGPGFKGTVSLLCLLTFSSAFA